MRFQNCFLLLSLLLLPVVSYAGESSKGTVIMISGVSGWLLLSSAFIFWKEIRKSRGPKQD